MKKLICAEDVTKAHAAGQREILITDQTIITPSAKDLAANFQIKWSKQSKPLEKSLESILPDNLTKEGLVGWLKALLGEDQIPFSYEAHPNGLKKIKGDSVQMAVFETGNPQAKVHYQELIGQKDSKISAGFLEIENSSFDWHLTYEELDYVIEGTLQVTIDGKMYTAKAGDVLFVPKNSQVTWGSPDKAKIFYATYPANWADLTGEE